MNWSTLKPHEKVLVVIALLTPGIAFFYWASTL
jgi:hypothetical protein